MNVAVLVIVRVVIAVVLVAAAVSKVLDRAGTARAARDLGVPPPFATAVATALPLVELLAAALLVPGTTARVGGALSLALFAAFTVALGLTMARGERPDCHCFGQVSASPIGARTIARNAVLIVLAVTATVGGGPGVVEAVDEIAGGGGAAISALAVVVLAQAIALLHLRGRRRPVDTTSAGEPTGLDAGDPAPPFALPTLDGPQVSLDDLRSDGRAVMLVFTSPGCAPCAELLPDLAAWQGSYAGLLEIAVVAAGGADANRDKLTEHGLRNVLLDDERAVATAYRYQGTPGAVVVTPEGEVASAIASGPLAIRTLVATTVAERASGSTSSIELGELAPGDDAPGFLLPTTHGHPVSLDDLAGAMTMLVFWDTACGYCKALLPDLRSWESDHAGLGVNMLLVATGSAEALDAQGWRSHVALDAGSVVARSYGGYGTPTAVLVDAAGRIASDVAVGADEVLALADRGAALAQIAASITADR